MDYLSFMGCPKYNNLVTAYQEKPDQLNNSMIPLCIN